MMPILTACLLILTAAYTEIGSGLPGTVDYMVPEGFQTEALPVDSTWAVVNGDSGSFTVVPLVLADTLDLPPLTGWNAQGDTMTFQPPLVIAVPSFPDTLMDPSFPVYPCFMDIPPGLPEDYARNMSFWLVWTQSPPFPWLPVAGGVLLLAAAAFFLIRRKRSDTVEEEAPEERIPPGKEAEREALALLESENYLHGRWPQLFTEVDRQYRVTVAGKFGVANRALTHNQITRAIVSSADGRKFNEEAAELVREITLQLYADWGSSRDRAAGFIRKLAKLRREWSR